MGSYNCLVDLMGHKHLGGKTLLYMIDALYAAMNNNSDVSRFQSFGDDWCSSLFISQDPVAIDSVGLDFMRNEPGGENVCSGLSIDNYLHEAALVNDPPSGIFYNPNGDGVRLESLGVHEHWNNAVDKQYSRNLGIGDGIELIAVLPTCPDSPSGEIPADLTSDGAVNAHDLAMLVQAWLADTDDPRWDKLFDLSADKRINFDDLVLFSLDWR